MSVLVDTSVWVDHLRSGDEALAELLKSDLVICHPFVVGELACSRPLNRASIIGLLRGLYQLGKVDDAEILYFIEKHQLAGEGLGLIDMHLLASTKLNGTKIWTRDRRLEAAARTLDIAY